MEGEKKKMLPAVSRRAEEEYLARTQKVVHDNVENYGQQVKKMQADIDEMLEHYHDNDAEVYTILSNTVTMHAHMKRALERNERAMKKPYFGRIVFYDETLQKEESLYIGRGGIAKDTTHWMVVDWRAPVANAYYENGLGKCSYPVPEGGQMPIDLQLKRTYEIDGGTLLDYYDSEVVANDELLTKYLARNKQAVLGEIIATIQKEQNDIIRKSPHHNVIVQGVAGSGKTTVAMHRISFILYNYQEAFRPDDFYIVGSNRILLNYITGVLPELDVYGVRQMTMEQLFVRLLYEDWDEKKHRIAAVSGRKGSAIKGKTAWFEDLAAYCERLEQTVIPKQSIYLDPRQFVEGYQDGRTGVFDRREGKPPRPGQCVLLMDREAIERYIRQNPLVSVQSKIDMLNERLTVKIKEEFLGKGVKYTEAEKKAILKEYRGRFGPKRWKTSIYELYAAFLKEQAERGKAAAVPEDGFDVYDLAALAYLYKRVKETELIREAHHIVIDEAQDYGMMAYRALDFCVRGCTYTIMGDVSQNIRFGYGLNDWEELKELLLSGERDSFGVLKKSYRNTVEISEFATNILHHGQFSLYPVEPIIRHGEPVSVRKAADREQLIREAAAVCAGWREEGFDTIAVVCRDQRSADRAAAELGEYLEVMESDPERAEFGSGVMVLPVEYTKGLEFDAVLILDPVREEYPVDDGHAKLLYVAATRALHRLCVLHAGELTGLIADPIPKRKRGSDPVRSAEAKGTAGKEKRAGDAQPKGMPSSEVKKRISIARGSAEAAPGSAGGRTALQGRNENRAEAAPAARSQAASRPRIQLPGSPQPQQSVARAHSYVSSAPVKLVGVPQTAPKEAAARPRKAVSSGTDFGDMPSTDKLRAPGHAKIDLAIRWTQKRPDGLYLQSRYGVLRLCPVGGGIVRVTFARGSEIEQGRHPGIAVDRLEKNWKYRESASAVELTTEELTVVADKATGALTYRTRDNRLLFAERAKECRQLEPGPGGLRCWLYCDWQKGETLYGLGGKDSCGVALRSTARYISGAVGGRDLPFVLSDRGYGILLADARAAISCDLPAYGSYLYTEGVRQLDFYFIAGKKQNTVLNAYGYLTGQL